VRPIRKVSLSAEAFCWLMLAALAVRIMTFDAIVRRLSLIEKPAKTGTKETLQIASASQQLRTIGGYLEKLARWSSLKNPCLPIALAGWAMLRIRQLDSAIVLGAQHKAGQLKAHAWLLDSDGHAVTGRRGGDGFKPISQFWRALPDSSACQPLDH